MKAIFEEPENSKYYQFRFSLLFKYTPLKFTHNTPANTSQQKNYVKQCYQLTDGTRKNTGNRNNHGQYRNERTSGNSLIKIIWRMRVLRMDAFRATRELEKVNKSSRELLGQAHTQMLCRPRCVHNSRKLERRNGGITVCHIIEHLKDLKVSSMLFL